MNVQPAIRKDRAMTIALDDHHHHGGAHPASLAPLPAAITARGPGPSPGRVVRSDLLGEQTHFSGEARVAQVMRWVSTVALLANDAVQRPGTARTPEVQVSAVGGRLLMGTNASDDSHLPAAMHSFLQDRNKVNATSIGLIMSARAKATANDHEGARVSYQQARHLQKLHNFITDDKSFTAFRDSASSEIQQQAMEASSQAFTAAVTNKGQASFQAYRAFDDQVRTTSAALGSIRSALNRADGIEMAPNTRGKHAEQRVIEHIQANYANELRATQASLGFDSKADVRLPTIIAGTKPPCDMCETTERARDYVAMQPGAAQSRLFIRRYEDPSYESGPLFPGNYTNTADHSVRTAMTAPGQIGAAAAFPAATVSARKRADSFNS